MNKKPHISKKLLEKINSVHANATQFFNSINPEVLQLIPIKVPHTKPPTPPKIKR